MKRPPGEQPLATQRRARHEPTEPENRLWQALRNRQLDGAKFRHQVWIGEYLVDFYCAQAKLIIEVDGDGHALQQRYDARRTAWLIEEGFRVIRFSNDDVMRNLDGVAQAIAGAIPSPSPRHRRGSPPSPLKGEGQ